MSHPNRQRKLRAAAAPGQASLAGTRRNLNVRKQTPPKEEQAKPSGVLGSLESLWVSFGGAASTILRSVTVGIGDLFRDDSARRLWRRIEKREIVSPITACLIVPVALLLIYAPKRSFSTLLTSGPLAWLVATVSSVVDDGNLQALTTALVGLVCLAVMKCVAVVRKSLSIAVPWVAYTVLATSIIVFSLFWSMEGLKWFGSLNVVVVALVTSHILPGAPGAIGASYYIAGAVRRARNWTAGSARMFRVLLVLLLSPAISGLFIWSSSKASEYIPRKPYAAPDSWEIGLAASSCFPDGEKVMCRFLAVMPSRAYMRVLTKPPIVLVKNDDGRVGYRLQSILNQDAPVLVKGGDSVAFHAVLPKPLRLCAERDGARAVEMVVLVELMRETSSIYEPLFETYKGSAQGNCLTEG